MFSNKIFKSIFYLLVMAASFYSCKKEDDFTPIDMDDLNPDVPYNANTPLDQWLKVNFLDMYNSEVSYRYSRFDHEYDRNITPIDADRVQPFMETVLGGFANPYVAVAGTSFMKVNMPKQWMLYGSTSYSSTTSYWGTAVGGVRVNIYDLNTFAKSNADIVQDRLGTIHHEFTHILNQRIQIPAEFREISKDRYTGSWESVNIDTAKSWGFMRNYSAQNPMEDFADMVKYPVVWGQPWFDNLIRTKASTAGAAALRAKEQVILQYFNSMNIDFRELQKSVQLYLKDSINQTEVKFPYWINQGLYKTVTINLNDPMYATYGKSADFETAYAAFRDSMRAINTTALYRMDNIQLRFETPTTLVVRVPFTATAGTAAGTSYLADYSFSVAVNSATGATTFTKVAQGTTTTFTNGNLFLSAFGNTIQSYLTSGTFIADWIPINTPANMFTKTGGFTRSGAPANYFYGTLGQTL